MKYIGRDNTKVLFSLDNVGVLVDELTKAERASVFKYLGRI